MDEYIGRKVAIRCVANQCVDGKMWGNEETEGTLVDAYELMDDLSDIPAADVAPVRHGRWNVVEGRRLDNAICSNCGRHFQAYYEGYSFCPNCGAKMDGGARDVHSDQ